MPVLKIKKNGIYQDIATAEDHAHTINDISDLPESIVGDVEALKDKVGAESVAFQITTAIQAMEGNDYTHPATHPANMITGLSDVAISGDYNDLINKPDISNIEGLADVATSGDYNDLINKPTIPSIAGLATTKYVDDKIASAGGSGGGMVEQVQADWDETDTTSPAYIKNKPVISGDGSASVQANWNQNDETQPDYIKNKPFGQEEIIYTDIHPLEEISGFGFVSEFNSYGAARAVKYTLNIGESYTVFWDDVEYECVAQDASSVVSGAVAIGNGSAFGFSGNNEPFAIVVKDVTIAYLAGDDTNSSHTVRIAQKETIIKKIENKYLSIIDINSTEEVELLPLAEYGDFAFNSGFGVYMYSFAVNSQLTIGESYTVFWDGVEYECVAQDVSSMLPNTVALGNCLAFGFSGNNEPFIVAFGNDNGTDMVYLISLTDAEPNVHNARVIKPGNTSEKINPKYMPIPYFGDGGAKSTTIISATDMQFSFNFTNKLYMQEFLPTTEMLTMWQSDWTSVDVTWDGTVYTCKPQYIEGIIKCIGNVDLMMSGSDNGMPFILMMADAATFGVDAGVLFSIVDEYTDIYTNHIDDLLNFSEVEGQSYYKADIGTISLDEGTEYKVFWRGSEYYNIATSYTSDDASYIAIGNPSILGLGDDNGFEYFIYVKTLGDSTQICEVVSNQSGASFGIVYAPDTTHNVALTMNQQGIVTIDPKYIESVSWDKVTDKPFGKITAGTIIIPATKVNITSPFEDDLYYAIVQNMGLSDHIRDGGIYLVNIDGITFEANGYVYSTGEVGLYCESAYVNFEIIDNFEGMGISIIFASRSGQHTFSIAYNEDVIKTIDPKFIPKIDGLPEVSADDNDKVLKVVNGAWSVQTPASGLPEVSADDAGKFLRVSADGTWIVETIQNVAEVGL